MGYYNWWRTSGEELEEKGIHVEHLTAVPGRILTESAGIILARMIERGAADYGRV